MRPGDDHSRSAERELPARILEQGLAGGASNGVEIGKNADAPGPAAFSSPITDDRDYWARIADRATD